MKRIYPKIDAIADGLLAAMNTIFAITVLPKADIRVASKVLYAVCAVMWWANFAMSLWRLKRDKE